MSGKARFSGLLFASVAFASADGAAERYAKSCKGCHGADGFQGGHGHDPALKDLSVDEVKAALAGYKAGTYGGEKKAMMERVVQAAHRRGSGRPGHPRRRVLRRPSKVVSLGAPAVTCEFGALLSLRNGFHRERCCRVPSEGSFRGADAI
jgi:cytochrome c